MSRLKQFHGELEHKDWMKAQSWLDRNKGRTWRSLMEAAIETVIGIDTKEKIQSKLSEAHDRLIESNNEIEFLQKKLAGIEKQEREENLLRKREEFLKSNSCWNCSLPFNSQNRKPEKFKGKKDVCSECHTVSNWETLSKKLELEQLEIWRMKKEKIKHGEVIEIEAKQHFD